MTRIIIFNLFLILSLIHFSSCCPRAAPAPAPVTTCAAVSSPANGQVSYSSGGRTVGSTLTYGCNAGRYVQGPTMRTCQSNAQWSGSDSICSPITCNNQAAGPNSNVVYEDSNGQVTDYGKTATFTCSSGYVLVGSNPLTCQGTNQPGTWSASQPTCARQCPSITAGNGQVTYSSSDRPGGSTLTVSCNAGYYVQGAAERTCQSSGTWSGSAATCQPIFCSSFSSFQNGSVSYSSASGSDIPYGATAAFSCNTPLSLKGSTPITCQGTTNPGTWSTFTPFCSTGVVCPNPGTLPNGQIKGGNLYFDGAVLSFTCNANYELSGSSSMTCSSSGAWSASLPTCAEKRYDCSGTEPCNPPVVQGKSLYRHVQNDKYVQCNSGACYMQSCPPGLVFNGNYCDWPPTSG